MARKEKKYHFIYKTTNLLNGKYYIGMHSTNDLEDGYMGSGKRLRYSINKYGKENHKVEILEFVDNREELKKIEKEIVNLNEIAKDNCMNLMVGGKGGFISDEQQRERSIIANKILNEKLKNDKEFYENFKLKISDGAKKSYQDGRKKINFYDWNGKKHTEETKKKMSEIKKGTGIGEKNSQFGTIWITKNEENKKIKKEDLNKWMTLGWIRGMVSKNKNLKK